MDRKPPLYIELRQYIIDAIIDGTYVEGGLLPSVRSLATEQGANPLTVAKAYQYFQDTHLVKVERGVGLRIISGAQQKIINAERDKFLTIIWPKTYAKMAQLNISIKELQETIF